ncbi:MAG: GMC family oxidoreductase [Sphaerochaetaceae bacterium]|nr:GMC family oxidoreductase [Sphaerochaetaceae bacterium]
MQEFDICIIGSGAGAGPVAYELSGAGHKVAVLEKGEFYKREDFSKDEIAFTKRDILTPKLKDEYHTIVEGEQTYTTTEANWSFWNGSLVGGASNLMSGFFHRFHPDDFHLASKYKKIDGANIVDWPITYDDLAPYYDKVEEIVGVSGELITNKYQEPRAIKSFPYPATQEHPIVKLIDKACIDLKITPVVTPRAVLSKDKDDRSKCYYSNYCGSYGCSSGAKGSSREALLNPALKTGKLTIITNAFVVSLNEKDKKVVSASYVDKKTQKIQTIKAKVFVLAAQAIESSRLLLNSKSKNFPNGLANNNAQVGKNLLFSAGGVVSGMFDKSSFPIDKLLVEGYFVNRVVKDFYFLDKDTKGGILEFLFEHANPIRKANSSKWDKNGKLIWGEKLYKTLNKRFNESKKLNVEIFNDWLPNDRCSVSIDEKNKDKYGINVAKVDIYSHPENEKIGDRLALKAIDILKQMGAKDINGSISPYPPVNLQAGGCRFGDDAKSSVLDKNCKPHEVENLFVTDGSFMPNGGSVPYTFTIYANSFRVADFIKNNLF